MHVDSVPARPHPMSAATWCVLGAVIVLLAALALFLMGCNSVYGLDKTQTKIPNYYACQVNCIPGFGVGNDVEVIGGGSVQVFDSPNGTSLGSVPLGTTGTILEGPQTAFWRVMFPTLTGWVRQTRLEVVGPVQSKVLDACVPYEWNANRPEFDSGLVKNPDQDCAERVAPAFVTHHASELMPGTVCSGAAVTNPSEMDESCTQDCADPTGVCVRMGWDPDPPVPDPVSVAVFATTTVCEVTGTANLVVDGHAPKRQPGVRGVVQILGRPCPGASCQLGVAFHLTGDDIEFDSGTVFASDPKFVDLNVSGVTEPAAINVGPFLGCTDCSFGALGPGTLLTTMQGTRPLLFVNLPGKSTTFKNTQSLALAVNWVTRTCRLAGDLGGQVEDDDGGALDITADVALDGVLVNQPPAPNTSATQTTLECTSPQGAPVTLDGSGSSDPDNDIAFYVWRLGSDAGPHVAAPSRNPVVSTSQGIGQTTYDLRVVDTRFAADHSPVTVSVVDSTAPTISCNAPATITPSDVPENPKKGTLSFKATATDVCSGVSAVTITGFACTKPESCQVQVQGDTITILDSGGVGDTITWTVAAGDGTGNVGQTTCSLDVVKKR